MRLTALLVVTAWAAFSLLYLGVEDGSSGLSFLGNLTLAYFLPSALLLEELQGSHRNSDVPLMAGVSWLLYAAVGQLLVSAYLWAKSLSGQKSAEA